MVTVAGIRGKRVRAHVANLPGHPLPSCRSAFAAHRRIINESVVDCVRTCRKPDFAGTTADILARMRLVIGLAGMVAISVALQQGRAQTPEKPLAVSLC